MMITKTWKRYLGLSIVVAGAAGSFAGALRAEDNSINWLGDYQEARKQSRLTQKPIFVEFRCEA